MALAIKKFLIKNYHIIFYSYLIEGMIFLILFLSGLDRYRFALAAIAIGGLSTLNQYLVARDSKIDLRWDRLQVILPVALLLCFFDDFSKGQILPLYPNLAFWRSSIIATFSYFAAFLMHPILGELVLGITDNEIFAICPKCGFGNIQVVKQCKHCGYTKDMPLKKLETGDLPQELKDEIVAYQKQGLSKKVPKKVLIGLSLAEDEHILISISRFHVFNFGKISKNGHPVITQWFIITNKKIVIYSGMNGWQQLDFIKYHEIQTVDVIVEQIFLAQLKPTKLLIIKTAKDIYKIWFRAHSKKMLRMVHFHRDNSPVLKQVLNCIEKRNLNIHLPHL